MLTRTKRKLKKFAARAALLLAAVLLVGINVRRFNNNIYSNYEKAVDYGRVADKKEVIEPVLTAFFYRDRSTDGTREIGSYLGHASSYGKYDVKSVIVPLTINADNLPVVQKLYAETGLHNKIKDVLLILPAETEAEEQKKIISENLKPESIRVLRFDKDFPSAEAEKYMQKPHTLTVTAADLENIDANPAAAGILDAARKTNLKVHVFDALDSDLATAAADGYNGLFSAETAEKEPAAVRQQRNLQKYTSRYGTDLLKYFKQNLSLGAEKEIIFPEKNPQTYRLYDRGSVYVRFFGADKKEIFARAKVGKNKGIVVSLAELARKAARKAGNNVKSYKIYLLTDFEPAEEDISALINNLQRDDGIYMKYKNKNALAVYDECEGNPRRLPELLRRKAGVPQNADENDITFYTFKTVETEDGN